MAVFDQIVLQAGLAPVAVAQQTPAEVGLGLLGSAVTAFVSTLIVGGIMIAAFPNYTERTMRNLIAEPGSALLYGLLALVALVVLTIALVLTIIGVLLAIPLVILAYLLWTVGAAIAFVAIGERLVGSRSGLLRPLLVGSAVNALLVLTGIGGLIAFVIGAAGFGALLRGS